MLCRTAFPTAHELHDKQLQQVLQRQLRLYTTGAQLGWAVAYAHLSSACHASSLQVPAAHTPEALQAWAQISAMLPASTRQLAVQWHLVEHRMHVGKMPLAHPVCNHDAVQAYFPAMQPLQHCAQPSTRQAVLQPAQQTTQVQLQMLPTALPPSSVPAAVLGPVMRHACRMDHSSAGGLQNQYWCLPCSQMNRRLRTC